MFIKHGDNQPITQLIDLTELDEKKAQKSLKEVKELILQESNNQKEKKDNQ